MKKFFLVTGATLMLAITLVASSPVKSASFIDPAPNPCISGKITGNWGRVYNFGTPSVYIVWDSYLSAYTNAELQAEWTARNTPIPYAWTWRTVCNSIPGPATP